MISLTLGYSIMMQLGTFQFGITTAAYQELTRRTEYRWAQQERYGKRPNLQFTGIGQEAMTLPGVIYPEYRGGLEQVDDMRALAELGQPLQLIDGYGNLMGSWVIESVEERQSIFADGGRPRKQEFTLQLKRFENATSV